MKRHGHFVLSMIGLVIAAGCGQIAPPTRSTPPTSPISSSAAPEAWIAKPHAQWPQIVLTNEADFHDHSSIKGASAFLLEAPDGRVLAATARHLLGGTFDEPPIAIDKLNAAIKRWRMYPRTLPDQSVEIDKVAVDGLDAEHLDWLLLTLKKNDLPLPAQALQIRADPVGVGEKVYLIGCVYEDKDCKQSVFPGTVTERVKDRFRYDLDTPIPLRGLSGAPILDKNGYLVGVMTISFRARFIGSRYLEGGGEDACSLLPLFKNAR